ncbi:MAG TPA: CBS domain-containing protein [Anaerolineae bacterium]
MPPPAPLAVILTHENTDFDALAAMLAASKLYPQALPVLPRHMNRNLEEFLALYGDGLPFIRLEDLPRRKVDRAIVVDTQGVQPVRGMHAGTTGYIMDHHPLMHELPEGWTFWGEEVGATTTLLVEKLAEQEVTLTPIEATLLMLGIYEDTGALSYETTTPRDLRSAAWLLENGTNLLLVDKFLHHPLTDEQRLLYQQLADSSHPYQFSGHSVIISTATVAEPVAEISTLAHKLRDLYEPDAVFMLVQMGATIQLVARSTSDAIDVSKIATALGGGGHSRAAAALIREGTLHSIYETLVYLLQSNVKPPVTVGQIMSYGAPQTLRPNDTIGEAASRMQRYGFEGFPVVDKGRVIGMLTRREIDRALHHGLSHHAVSRYMRAGEVYVTPADSVETLRRVMSEHDWGQVPVLDSSTGEMVGIVTRTDLIKQWSAPHVPRPEKLDQQMADALPGPLLGWLRQAGAAAQEMGYHLYAVGGFVRDLLLGVPNYDIDLVVEGDAIGLAQQLSERLGGRVRSHKRFGTAKWIVPDHLRARTNSSGLLPDSLDFVTARTEFYEHPTALPTVERSSIKQDLHRRDFTINTLALRLEPDRWGELLDFYGGKRDLEEGLIRVLHNLSFVEDPTRILRAVRFEQRFGFTIEARSERLIADARNLIARVSGERVRHELVLIMEEAEPERSLGRLGELGILEALQPGLVCDVWLQEKAVLLRDQFRVVRDPASQAPAHLTLADDALPRLYMALLTYRLPSEDLDQFIVKYRLLKDYRDILLESRRLKARLPALAQNDLPLSEIARVLEDAGEEARFLARVVADSWLVQQRLDLYQRRLRRVQPLLRGDDLRRLGIPPGPIYRQVLDALRAARLDGQTLTRPDEEALARQIALGVRATEPGSELKTSP